MSAVADPQFLVGVLDRAVEAGYVEDPRNSVIEQDNDPSILCCFPFCCVVGGPSRDKDRCAIITAVCCFVISSIVAFFYAARSAKSARQAHEDIRSIQDYLAGRSYQLPPAIPLNPFVQGYSVSQPFSFPVDAAVSHGAPGGYGQPPIAVSLHQYPPQQPQQYPQLQPVYGYQAQPQPMIPQAVLIPNETRMACEQALILLEGQRQERIVAAISQSVMGVGAGLITVALLIAMLETNLAYQNYLIAGGVVTAAGIMIWVGKNISLTNSREQMAAQHIAYAIRA